MEGRSLPINEKTFPLPEGKGFKRDSTETAGEIGENEGQVKGRGVVYGGRIELNWGLTALSAVSTVRLYRALYGGREVGVDLTLNSKGLLVVSGGGEGGQRRCCGACMVLVMLFAIVRAQVNSTRFVRETGEANGRVLYVRLSR